MSAEHSVWCSPDCGHPDDASTVGPQSGHTSESGPTGPTETSGGPTERTVPRLWRATDLSPAVQPRWLAVGRLPRAAVSLLVGDEGIGKSLLWVWVAAAITTGKPLPEFGIPARDPEHVIIVATEDDWSTTVRPRLEVAGADLDMIGVICTEPDGTGSPQFPRDIPIITTANINPALIVVDAWLDTVPGNLIVRDPQQARIALHPWKDVASRTDAAVLLLTHTNRVSSGSARDKYGATGELRKKARLTLFAQQDEDGALIVGPEKINIAAPVTATRFKITPVQYFPPSDDSDGSVPLLTYDGDSGRTAGEHLADAYEREHSDEDGGTEAEHWLTDYLTMNGESLSADAKTEARKVQISERTLKRAAKTIGVVVGSTGFPRKTTWSLTSQSGHNAGQSGQSGHAESNGPTVAQLDCTGPTTCLINPNCRTFGTCMREEQTA